MSLGLMARIFKLERSFKRSYVALKLTTLLTDITILLLGVMSACVFPESSVVTNEHPNNLFQQNDTRPINSVQKSPS